MLVEFTRGGPGHIDNEDEIERLYPIAINPNHVGAVFDDQEHPGCVVLRIDGRGLIVRGSFGEVVTKLNVGVRGNA